MTDAERRLWYRLRAHRFGGIKFKRQVPIGSYVVDFASLNRKLILEIDGGQHADSEADRRREQALRKQGFEILRFWNNDVLRQTDGVLEAIMDAVKARPGFAPSPGARRAPPSPRWGEGTRG